MSGAISAGDWGQNYSGAPTTVDQAAKAIKGVEIEDFIERAQVVARRLQGEFAVGGTDVCAEVYPGGAAF